MQPPLIRRLMTLTALIRNPPARHDRAQTVRATRIVLATLLATYALTGWFFPRWLSSWPALNYYFLQPLMWAGVAVCAYGSWRRLSNRPDHDRVFTLVAFSVGVFQVAILVVAGFISGFGASPTAGRLANYPLNALYLGTLLLGFETSRAYLIHAWAGRSEQKAILGATVLFFLLSVPSSQWFGLGEFERVLHLTLASWAPALAVSAAATWLAARGGVGPSFAYRAAILSFTWLSPVLPDLDWATAGVIGAVSPLVAIVLADSISRILNGGGELSHQRRQGSWLWPAVSLVLVLTFVGGWVSGLRPSVIDGISMNPTLRRGDVAIIDKKVIPEAIRVGDIVKFREGPLQVVHRVVSIHSDGEGRSFITRGDNNPRDDPPIRADELEGRVILSIPWVGFPSLWLRGQ